MNRTARSDYPSYVGVDRVFLTAEWQHLAMLNYEVDAGMLLPFVPAGSELDRWKGKVFASLVGFRFLKTKLLGFLPILMHSNFEEVNLRFYVRRQVGDEVRRGVVFIRELVPRRAIAFVARTFYKEDYVALPMAHEIRSAGDNRLRVAYRWRSENRWSAMNLETDGESELPGEGSVEQFITEHYWGYSRQKSDRTIEYRVIHIPWGVRHASEARFEGNASGLYGADFAAVLSRAPDSAQIASGSPIEVLTGSTI